MSTNHRPRLETKKGIKRDISGSIAHARGMKQQMGLKYRHDQVFEVSENEAKDDENDETDEIKKIIIENDKDEPKKLKEKSEKIKESHKEESKESQPQTIKDNLTKEISEGESLDNDSEDEAELLKELENLQKPELQPEPEPQQPQKKSWRKSKFKKPKVQDDYTNNSIDSKFHQDFLNKFVK